MCHSYNSQIWDQNYLTNLPVTDTLKTIERKLKAEILKLRKRKTMKLINKSKSSLWKKLTKSKNQQYGKERIKGKKDESLKLEMLRKNNHQKQRKF